MSNEINANTQPQNIQSLLSTLVAAFDTEREERQNRKTHLVIERSDEAKLVVPKGMPLADVEEWVRQHRREAERITEVYHAIPGDPLDGAVAFYRVLQRTFGFVGQRPTPTFFGPRPPVTISVRTGPNPEDTVQVPWERVTIPGLDPEKEFLDVGNGPITDGQPTFLISGEIQKQHEDYIRSLAAATAKEMQENSIYKGHAIRVDFSYLRDRRRNYHPDANAPKFIPLHGRLGLIWPSHVEALLDIALYGRIEREMANAQVGVSPRTAVLLAGDYGTGKTALAMDLASVATSHGWLFIMVENTADLPHAVRMAQQYASEAMGVVIFAEDIDKAASTTDVNHAIQYALDGAESKTDKPLIVVLTTNYVDRIDPALLRPGRLDKLIYLEPADADAAERFVRSQCVDTEGNSLLEDDADLSAAASAMVGYTPAFLAEVVRSAKMMAVSRGTPVVVTADMLATSARGLRAQHDLIAAAANRHEDPTVHGVLEELLNARLDDHLSEIREAL